jgi:hypothetical protein
LRKTLALMIIPILVISGLYAVLPAIPRAHAPLVGEVCIAKNLSVACPQTPPLINSTGPPAPQLRVAVVVNASDSLNSFEITLLTNNAFLKPAGYSMTNSVLKQPLSTVAACIGNTGLGCTTTDSANTLHIGVGSQTPTFSPATGLLFTAIYNITGNTYNAPISFQTGCGATSVAGGVCVTIGGGSPQPLSETIQTAKFTDLLYFDFQPLFPFVPLTIPLGSTDSSLTLNVTSINNFQGTVNLAVSIPSSPPGITVVFSKNPLKVNITSPSNVQDFSQVTVTVASTANPGNYILNFTATAASSPAPPNILLIPLTVPPPDYSITPNPGTLSFNVSISATSVITLRSLANFAGRVNLTLGIPANVHAGLQTASLLVPKGGSISTTLTVNSTISGTYLLNITGVSTGLLPHKASVRIVVFDYEMDAPAGTLVLSQGSANQRTIKVQSVGGLTYAVNVSISKIYINQITSTGPVGPATGITVNCNPAWANVTVTGTSSLPANTGCNVVGNVPGNYTVTVVGTSGRVSHAVTFSVIVSGPDFSVTPTPAIQTVDQGKTATVSLLIARQLGLTSNVTLTAIFVTGGSPPPTVAFNVPYTTLDPTHPNGTVIMRVTAGISSPIGPYTLELTALAGSTLQTHIITMSIVVTTTASPHDLAVLYVTPSSNSATIGSKIDITIEVANLGKVNETSTVLALAQGITVGQKNVTALAPGMNMNYTITWDTTGFSPGAYIITGQVVAVSGEGNKDNNFKSFLTPVTLNSANTSLLQSPYLAPSIIAAIIVIVAIVAFVVIQSRRKTPASAPSR